MEIYICDECMCIKSEDFWTCPNCYEDTGVHQVKIERSNNSLTIKFFNQDYSVKRLLPKILNYLNVQTDKNAVETVEETYKNYSYPL